MSKNIDWEEQAACRDKNLDPAVKEAFFEKTTAGRKPARELCKTCPVRLKCLSEALKRGETWGVWGGCDEVDLRRTLWTDTNGTERARKRFPRCPACRAATSNLALEADDTVRCVECDFSWVAKTSIEAVRIYFEENKNLATPASITAAKRITRRRQLAQRSRLPQDARKAKALSGPRPAKKSSQNEAVQVLVASARPRRDFQD